jgi:outer membrane immunogenic protein
MFWGNWSAKAEYLYVDLGRVSDSFNTIFLTGLGAGNAATRTDRSHIRENIFRVGLNYHINPRP